MKRKYIWNLQESENINLCNLIIFSIKIGLTLTFNQAANYILTNIIAY